MAKKNELTTDQYPVLASVPKLAEMDVSEDILEKIQGLADLIVDEVDDDDAFMIGDEGMGWRPTLAKVYYSTTNKDAITREASAGDIVAGMRILAKKEDREIWKVIPIAAEMTRIHFPDYGTEGNILEIPTSFYKDNVPEEEKSRRLANGAPYWNTQYTVYVTDLELSDIFAVQFSKTAARNGRAAMQIIKSLRKKHRREAGYFAMGFEVVTEKSKSGQEYDMLKAVSLKPKDEVQPPYTRALIDALAPEIHNYIRDRHARLIERYNTLANEAATFTQGIGASGEKGFEDDM